MTLTKSQKRELKRDAKCILHTFVDKRMFSALRYVLIYGRYSFNENGKSLYD